MSYSPNLSSPFTGGMNKSKTTCSTSGMCSMCTRDCPGTCEIALSAVLGAQTVYPITTGDNQIASEKNYPVDYSHFNMNGRVFGAQGIAEDMEQATVFNMNLSTTYGTRNQIEMDLPLILPALIKLNWKDYFAGAAMAGVSCVIGEHARNNDSELVIKKGQVVDFPFLASIRKSYEPYYRGKGQMILQCNPDDDLLGVPQIALQKYGFDAIEIKFGQSAKGVQPVIKIKDMETALKKKALGNLVHPDPEDPAVQKAYENGVCPNFYTYGRLPMWTEETISKHIELLRTMGAKNIYFKMAGYDSVDLERVLRMASVNGVDMVTFDGAGGGSGYSPSKMMNEWSYPTIMLENQVVRLAKKLQRENLPLPAITITGGFASEDQVFKALAFGDGLVKSVGLCRASMAAAMTGERIGNEIKNGTVRPLFQKYGSTVEEIFGDLPDLCAIYGTEARSYPTGAIGVFSYLRKIGFGVAHFAALNRKFNLSLLDRSDLIPLTGDAHELLK
ncbi:glutamate synthase-related protein [Oscillibacter sp.]|uniref:glutamate synthase-related protein n=1 Tax=Oscillibacter sp. TaxID=1945593 RepID=UPI002898AB9E|nr:glutamate synthase-related protein [Oscillibacter sp.]